MSSRLNRVLERVDQGEGSLGRLLNDPSLYDNLNRTADNLSTISSQVKGGEGTLGRLVTDERLYDDAAGPWPMCAA